MIGRGRGGEGPGRGRGEKIGSGSGVGLALGLGLPQAPSPWSPSTAGTASLPRAPRARRAHLDGDSEALRYRLITSPSAAERRASSTSGLGYRVIRPDLRHRPAAAPARPLRPERGGAPRPSTGLGPCAPRGPRGQLWRCTRQHVLSKQARSSTGGSPCRSPRRRTAASRCRGSTRRRRTPRRACPPPPG